MIKNSETNARVAMRPGAFLVLIIMLMLGCTGKRAFDPRDQRLSTPFTEVKYADGFKVYPLGNATLVEVTYPFQGAASGHYYLLVPRGEKPPSHHPGTTVIFTPLENIVCTSTTHIPLLDYLRETDRLIGFPTTDYISSERMRDRIDRGEITELGVDKELNLERLAMLKPGAVMAYTVSGDYGQFKKIESMGIPVLINAEYLEQHPLGRAEWIKFMALFFNKEKEADSVFSAIEERYVQTAALADTASGRPSVMSGVVYGDAWFLPAGHNNAARLLRDAGCHYLWDDTPGTGYLQLSFESIYETAHQADLWIGTGPYSTLDEIVAADSRYRLFQPFQTRQVYNYDARKGARGGNEFLELGYLRPDLVLMDLVKIAHPHLLPGHELYFHRKLN